MSQGWGEGCTANLLSLESTLLAGGWARSWSQFTVHSAQFTVENSWQTIGVRSVLLVVVSQFLCSFAVAAADTCCTCRWQRERERERERKKERESVLV